MSDAKHTPGPWRLGFPKAGLYTVRTDNDYLMVASNVSRQDAHLIAAAPDLLAALERAMPLLTNCAQTYLNGDLVLKQAQEALKKVYGGDTTLSEANSLSPAIRKSCINTAAEKLIGHLEKIKSDVEENPHAGYAAILDRVNKSLEIVKGGNHA